MMNYKMNSKTCCKKAREAIPASVKQELLQHSSFACSICSAIPVVFHHIEEWSQKFSNDERYLLPICDRCHRSIHGEGGPVFTKQELYDYKENPKLEKVLKYKYHIDRKSDYSFFIGSNFIASGKKATLFKFGGYALTCIDISSGALKLSILSGVKHGKPEYLIKDNELLVNTNDMWNMSFSIPTLKIWRKKNGKKTVFIELLIKEDVIIIKSMNTEFDNKAFHIYKPRKPNKHKLAMIEIWLKEIERDYLDACKQLDESPKVADKYNGDDFDKLIKDSRKESIKYDLKRNLSNLVERELKWDWLYVQRVLDSKFEKSPVFRKKRDKINLTDKELEVNRIVGKFRNKYDKIFNELDDTVVEYSGILLANNLMF